MRRLEGYCKGLADANRLRILNLLLVGELCGCDIQRVLGLSQSNVSRHLSYLRQVGLSKDRRHGNRIFYRLDGSRDRTIDSLLGLLREAFSDESALRHDLARLKVQTEQGPCSVRAVPGRRGSSNAAGKRQSH